ncbi:unnamed protein product [Parnassius apollo]|uniref:(apollo) hypothetical protein n=1 Tax=Parnassius apollo TaxID=110799 RepID=A0A8S3WVY5_PARAO|nr:unnamed protein product [Parnassius apollo]
MHRLFAELEPSITATEQNLVDRVRYILRSNIFDVAELERLRREAVPSSGENATAEDSAPQFAEQTENVDAAVNTPVVIDSNDDGTLAQELELEQMRSTLEEAIVETRSTPLENRPRSKRNQAGSDIMQKLTERIDDLKQRIAAWGKRIRRYTERLTRFNQNRLFQSDQKRLYKSLERPMVSGTGPVPNQADTVAFWHSLWSEPVNHNEGPWTEVVASQCAGITSMDPVIITLDDVAEAVRRAPNWKIRDLTGCITTS